MVDSLEHPYSKFMEKELIDKVSLDKKAQEEAYID